MAEEPREPEREQAADAGDDKEEKTITMSFGEDEDTPGQGKRPGDALKRKVCALTPPLVAPAVGPLLGQKCSSLRQHRNGIRHTNGAFKYTVA